MILKAYTYFYFPPHASSCMIIVLYSQLAIGHVPIRHSMAQSSPSVKTTKDPKLWHFLSVCGRRSPLLIELKVGLINRCLCLARILTHLRVGWIAPGATREPNSGCSQTENGTRREREREREKAGLQEEDEEWKSFLRLLTE